MMCAVHGISMTLISSFASECVWFSHHVDDVFQRFYYASDSFK